MILETEKETILGNGAKASAFTIQASPKVFKILTSDLYTNKVRAVVRELITNMIDAHMLNGCQDKFIVQAPGELDPRFVCRDFGPGMSDFQIRGDENTPGLYNSFFASSKAESNDFIGGFGLGSKSPFSYTETFSLISYHDGQVNGYVAYMDGDGPQIKPTFSEPMKPGDRTGIEVVVPVDSNDFGKFRYEIAYIMRPFAGLAEVQGVGEINYFPEFDDYYAPERIDYSSPERYGLYAIYGGIVYPIGDGYTKKTWMTAKNDVVFIKFPMGSLDIAPSREALSLDKRTVANIVERIEALDKKVMEDDCKKWQESECVRHTYRELQSLNYEARNFLKARNAETKFTKSQLTFNQMYEMFELDKDLVNAGVVYDIYTTTRLKRLRNSSSNSNTASLTSMFGIQNDTLNIVIDDAKGRIAMIRGISSMLYDTSAKAKKLKASGKVPTVQGSSLLFVDPTSEIQTRLMAQLQERFKGDTVNIYRTSELTALVKDWIPVANPKERVKSKTPSVIRWTKTNGSWQSVEEFTCAADAEEIDGYAVFINRNSISPLNQDYGITNFGTQTLCKLANLLEINEFCVIRPQLQKKVTKLAQCDCLIEAAVNRYVELIDSVDADQYIAASSRSRYYIPILSEYAELNFMFKYFYAKDAQKDVNTDYAELMQFNKFFAYNAYNSGTVDKTMQETLVLCNKIYDDLTKNASVTSDKMVLEFEKNHPIVSHFLYNRNAMSTEQVQNVAQIMKAVEAANKE